MATRPPADPIRVTIVSEPFGFRRRMTRSSESSVLRSAVLISVRVLPFATPAS